MFDARAHAHRDGHPRRALDGNARQGKVQLSDALNKLTDRERMTSRCKSAAVASDIGVKYGLLYAQLALAMLAGEERDEILAQLVELLATRLRKT